MSRTARLSTKLLVRNFSKTSVFNQIHQCKLLVVGGGAGGCTVANLFAKQTKHNDNIVIVEPCETHYYQPMYTLIGAGIKSLPQAVKPMSDVLPKNAKWIKERVKHFNPENNEIVTEKGSRIQYDIMLVAVGLQLNYDQIPGLVEGLNDPQSGLSSNYSPLHVNKTMETLEKFEKGNAIFTFPNCPIKCAGAPQKAAYLSEDFLTRSGKRKNARVIYNTTLPVIFGVKKYADALWKVVERRNIDVNLRTNLIRVDPGKKIATFQNCDDPLKVFKIDYEMLNVTPPMSTPQVLSSCKSLVNQSGFVCVDKGTLQSTKFPNVFAIGDCASTPNAKTCAAVASQSGIVYRNMMAFLDGKTLEDFYDGYASCPLVTARGKCILAEFDYDLNPVETFPFNQAKERYTMYLMKKEFMVHVYWFMLRGYWAGPKKLRKICHLGINC